MLNLRIFLLFALLFTNTLLYPNSLLEKAYCTVLGDQDASPAYTALAHKALQEFGVTNPTAVPIKQMNDVGPRLVGMNSLLSFTAQGIWINEQALEKCSGAEKVFTLYHEAAHHSRNHHRQVLKNLSLLPLCVAGSILVARNIKSSIGQIVIGAGLSMLSSWRLVTTKVQPLVQSQERMADIDAANKLIATNKRAVVQEYIKALQARADTTAANDTWHPNIQEQIKYLTKCLTTKNA